MPATGISTRAVEHAGVYSLRPFPVEESAGGWAGDKCVPRSTSQGNLTPEDEFRHPNRKNAKAPNEHREASEMRMSIRAERTASK